MNKPTDGPNTSHSAFPILITGDVVVDHHIYEGERTTAAAYTQRGVNIFPQHGGAAGLLSLVQALIKEAETARIDAEASAQASVQEAMNLLHDAEAEQQDESAIKKLQQSVDDAKKRLSKVVPVPEEECSVAFALNLPELDSQPCGHHALATWKPFPRDPADPSGKEKVWRASLLMGYGHDEHSPTDVFQSHCPVYSPEPKPEPGPARLLILDDAGFVFRHKKDCWLLPKPGDVVPDWMILKMSGPVCQGDLWHRLTTEDDRLICIVSAADLRKEFVSLSTGLSWEQTVEDLYRALYQSPVLKSLTTVPRHLVVTFSTDGGLWVDNTNREEPKATLIFDAGGAEGEWARGIQGEAFGYMSCLVAAITRAVIHNPASPNLAPAVAAGLGAMRNLRELGHGVVGDEVPKGFPHRRLAKAILQGSGDFSFSPVPWSAKEREVYRFGSTERPWRIVEMSQRPFPDGTTPSLLGLARQVVLQGPAALKRLPHARFGHLLSADRLEIETLRTIRRSMLSYRALRKVKKPLSIGVFGPPGAGKSFGVKQISDDVFGEKAWLEFNLSQFSGPGDLYGAFHQVRDLVLGGITPVVFWDEFDSREYEWLQYLLAPMQDGRFQQEQLNHAIGKCVFIFAGGTSHTFEEFGPAPSEKKAVRKYRLRKGPDFHSRLDAFYNVLGPNPRTLPQSKKNKAQGERIKDQSDVCAPLRRALLIRALLNVKSDARLDFDPDLLDALLRLPSYKHGARSLEKLVTSLQPDTPAESIRRSALPPAVLVAMHVSRDDKHPEPDFEALLSSNNGFRLSQQIPGIAEAIHEAWRSYAKPDNVLNRPWAELSEMEKEDNLAAARRIPDVLALAGLTIEPTTGSEARTDGSDREFDPVVRQVEHHLERLAEAEHDGWVDQRRKNG